MRINRLPRSFRSYLPFLVCVAVLTVAIPRTQKLGYDYAKGQSWKYDALVSEFAFPIYKTDEQLNEEYYNYQSKTIPFYKYSDAIVVENLNYIDGIDLGNADSLRKAFAIAARKVYTTGILPDDAGFDERTGAFSEEVLYIGKDKHYLKYPVSEVLTVSGARAILADGLKEEYSSVNIDSIIRENGIDKYIVPNLVFDRQMTEMVGRKENKSISPTLGYIDSGVTLVRPGEVITAETEQVLESYAREYAEKIGGDIPDAVLWINNFLMALLLTAVFFVVMFFTSKGTFQRYGELDYVTFIFLLTSIVIILMVRLDLRAYLLAAPIPLAARYLEAFFKDKVILAVYMVSLLPLLLFDNVGTGYYFIFLLAGLVTVLLAQRLKRGLEQFLVVLATFAVMTACYFVMRRFFSVEGRMIWDILKLLICSFLSMALYPMVFLFERMFGLVSDSRLEELSDTGNRLLRDLELKAPGTFQHSLQVMSMCTTAAHAIDADEHLVRAAAMYHDIGKMNNPMCFIENSTATASEGPDYHSGLSAKQSAADIIRHVQDGVEMAEKYHIPRQIREFILSHHGTTTTGYFYNKYINEGGDPADKADFQYNGKVPRTKEQIILMLCDSVEAASRTIKNSTPEAYSDLVERIFVSKIEAGQFNKADITFEELVTVKEALKTYLAQLYHERVAYPKRNR